MRLHVVSLPHTETTQAYSWCAYTQKVRHFADMMSGQGHEVVLYAGERNEGTCAELVTCTGVLAPNGQIPHFDPAEPTFHAFNDRAIDAITQRIEARDVVCLIAGRAQQPIAERFRSHLCCEFGVGYEGVLETTHRVFESLAWMHTVYGHLYGAHGADGRFYDTVIPNSFDPADFPAGDGDGSYLLFVGRLTERKGIGLAIEIARASGLPLKVAGAGEYPLPDDVEYHGVVRPAQRAALMGAASALLCPTLYVEPFGGVAVEAQMCGTPAICTDWGAFTETIEHGVSGFRARTFAQFTDAVSLAAGLDREKIRRRAVDRYSLDAIAPVYDRYLNGLQELWGDGFYARRLAVAA